MKWMWPSPTAPRVYAEVDAILHWNEYIEIVWKRNKQICQEWNKCTCCTSSRVRSCPKRVPYELLASSGWSLHSRNLDQRCQNSTLHVGYVGPLLRKKLLKPLLSFLTMPAGVRRSQHLPILLNCTGRECLGLCLEQAWITVLKHTCKGKAFGYFLVFLEMSLAMVQVRLQLDLVAARTPASLPLGTYLALLCLMSSF